MPTTTTTNPGATASDEVTASFRKHAEASVKDAEALASTAARHSRDIANAVGQSVLDNTQRSGQLAVETWKAWSSAAASLPISPAFALPNAREVVDATFDLATGVLDAQRQLVHRLVAAATVTEPASR